MPQPTSPPKHVIVGGFCLPLDIESLEALPVDPGGVFKFDFTFHHIRFAIRYEEEQEHGSLRIVGDVGPMPFSAESPVARAGLAQIIGAANSVVKTQFKVTQGRIALGTELTINRPVTATKLIAAVAAALIPCTPYLDLIATYVRPPMMAPAKRGEPALRPEWRRRTLPKPGKR